MGLGKQEAKISPFTLLAQLGSGSHVLLQHLDVYQLQTGRTPCKILEMSQKHFQSSEKKIIKMTHSGGICPTIV